MAFVNQLGQTKPGKQNQTNKTVDELAREVLSGAWGNGSARQQKLTQAGYDYNAVQKRVNQLLGGGNTTGTSGTGTSNSQSLLNYFKQQNESARKSAIDAITARVNAQKGLYNNQLNDLGNQYQALRNQSEVERYKSRNVLREAQANRGQLGSGYGRQEQLLMDTQYGNAINSINLQEQSAKNEIKNLIQQIIAEGEADKTEINNSYANALQQYIASVGGSK
jgi:hypothetical protein